MSSTPIRRRFPVSYIENPTQEQLRKLAELHTPATMRTSAGSINKVSRNKARMAKYTYIIEDGDSSSWSHQTISSDKALELIMRQEEYIKSRGTVLVIDGYIGTGTRKVAATWYYTLEASNIAGMQQVLAFPPDEEFNPEFTVVYTPDFMPDDMPGNQAIIVDMETWTTYIMGPDYFGESKKAMLRMLNHKVYSEGGLVLHAGAKSVTKRSGEKILMTIMGLSGTGKTTTTFSEQGALTEPVQDDMVCLWPGGELSVTENGCFAKIEGLTHESEPVIYAGTTSADAWTENAYLEENGDFNFCKEYLTPIEAARYRDILLETGADEERLNLFIGKNVERSNIVDEGGTPLDGWDFIAWTGNGRSIIPLSAVPGAASLQNLPPVRSMGILNRDEGTDACTPGIVKFSSPSQAAGYFMLGETSKTSAAGKERGKTRSPFTQPFFPARFGLQAERFEELASTMPGVAMWMMNTGYIGGDAAGVGTGDATKVKIAHSSDMLEALLAEKIHWRIDEDFGYWVVDVEHPGNEELLQKVPVEILDPRGFYKSAGRVDDYNEWVRKMHSERREFLSSHGVNPTIVSAVCK